MSKRVLWHMRTTKAQISVAEQVSLRLVWSETPEDTFCRVVAQMYQAYAFSHHRDNRFSVGAHKHDFTDSLITIEPRHEKTCLREFPTWSDSNWPAQLQKIAWGLKFWVQKLETLHYLGREQQRRWSDCANAQADLRLCCSHMT